MIPTTPAMNLATIDWQTAVFEPAITTVVISLVAIALLMISIKVVDKTLPFDLHKELAEDDNVAAGIVVGAVILGVSIVIASVAHG